VVECTDDLTNYEAIEPPRLLNALLQSRHPGFKARETYDLPAASLDPTLTKITDNYSS